MIVLYDQFIGVEISSNSNWSLTIVYDGNYHQDGFSVYRPYYVI